MTVLQKISIKYILIASVCFFLGAIPYPQGAVEEYVEEIEGVWLSESRADIALDAQDIFRLEIRREWIYRDQVWIRVSPYCLEGSIDFLAFELRHESLHYVGAVLDKESYPLLYLDFVEILYEKEEGSTVLYYESAEAEGENHLNLKFHKLRPLQNSLL
ncbi:MAG: hypothetical protein AAF696_06765 [Bacteroidota bacterium]